MANEQGGPTRDQVLKTIRELKTGDYQKQQEEKRKKEEEERRKQRQGR